MVLPDVGSTGLCRVGAAQRLWLKLCGYIEGVLRRDCGQGCQAGLERVETTATPGLMAELV